MNKKYYLIKGSIFSRSGYGERLRDFMDSLIEITNPENTIIKIIATNWGDCANVDTNTDEYTKYAKYLVNPQSLNLSIEKPDIFIDCNVGNAFEVIPGVYNIGLTAGIETTMVDKSWVEKAVKMNLIIVSSNHSKKAYIERYKQMNPNASQIDILNFENKFVVLFEGVKFEELNIVASGNFDDHEYNNNNNEIVDLYQLKKEKIDNNYYDILVIGQWSNGQLFHERKNISGAIYTLLKYFSSNTVNGKKVRILLKTNLTQFSNTFLNQLIDNLANVYKIVNDTIHKDNLPPVILIHGDLDYSKDLSYLYNLADAMYTLTHGEGFGRPLLEFACTGKPIIAPDFSGYLDFLSKSSSNNIFITPVIHQIHPGSVMPLILSEDTAWAYADENNINLALHKLNEVPAIDREKAKYVQLNFSHKEMTKQLNTIISGIVENTKNTSSITDELDLPDELK